MKNELELKIDKLAECSKELGIAPVELLMTIYMELCLGYAFEATGQLMRVPYFQKHRGKKLYNMAHRLMEESDDRIYRFIGDKDRLNFINKVCDDYTEHIRESITRYRETINKILLRGNYPYVNAYVAMVTASSVIHLADDMEQDSLIGMINSISFVNDGGVMKVFKGYSDYVQHCQSMSVRKLRDAFLLIEKEFDTVRELQDSRVTFTPTDRKVIENISREVVGRFYQIGMLVDSIEKHSRKVV